MFRSAVVSRFECMFDGSLPEISDLSSLSDAALVDAIGGVTRAENAACAVKVAAMAELFCRRTGLTNAEDRDSWWVDPEAAVAAEIGAAGGISQGLALSQTHRGVALRDRLPKVAALFAAGVISDLLVRTIVWRTALVLSPEAMAELDLELAQRVTRWGALSVKKTEQAIDELVEGIDPGALRRGRASGTARGVQFGSPADEPGFITMWARLYATDGVVIEQRVEETARSVCDADPRDADERRADALTAAVSHTAMACECGQPDCPGAAHERPPKNAVVYVVADEKSVRAATAAAAEAAPSESASSPAQCPAPPAFVFGGGVLPTALLGAIVERATIREVRHPGGAPPEPRYTPTLSTADFVRCRDLTCRFPGCDKPAQFCDLDHTVPYPVGSDASVKPEVSVPFSPHSENVLERGERVAGPTTARRHHHLDFTDRPHLHDLSRAVSICFRSCVQPTGTLWTGEPPGRGGRPETAV